MFEWCSISVSDDRVGLADVLAAPRVGDEVDGLGRVADHDDLARIRRAEERPRSWPAHPRRPPSLPRRSRRSRDGHWRCTRSCTASSASATDARLEGSRGAVEIRQAAAAELALEDREVGADRDRIECRTIAIAVLAPLLSGSGRRSAGSGASAVSSSGVSSRPASRRIGA